MTGRKPVAIYGRVLIDWLTTENEILALREVAARHGWEVGEIYIDHAIRGTSGRNKRPAFDKFCKDAKGGQFDSIMMWSIGQIAQTLHGISAFIAEMKELGIAQFYHQEAIDTSTSAGKAMAQMCTIFSEFKRGLVHDRRSGSSKRTRTVGNRLGRAKLDPQTEWAICQALASGAMGVQKIATDFSVPSSTVQRIKAEMSKLT